MQLYLQHIFSTSESVNHKYKMGI